MVFERESYKVPGGLFWRIGLFGETLCSLPVPNPLPSFVKLSSVSFGRDAPDSVPIKYLSKEENKIIVTLQRIEVL